MIVKVQQLYVSYDPDDMRYIENEINNWLSKFEYISIRDIKYSTCSYNIYRDPDTGVSGECIYESVLIFYDEFIKG